MCQIKMKWSDVKRIIVISMLLLMFVPVAIGDGTSVQTVTVLAPPGVTVELTPDDDPVTPGVQVINPEPSTNKAVNISATVTDGDGYSDIVSVIANITGPSVIEDSPVSLSFDHAINVTTATYKGLFNMSSHSEGDYKVEVMATDFGGLTGVGSKNFTYLYGAPVVTVTTYDFATGAGVDKWAFRKQHFAKPPAVSDVPDDEFTAEQYENIMVDDGTMQVDASSGNGFYAIHRFNFSIAEPEGSITKLDILWDGNGAHDWGTDGATLYLRNFETGSYEQLNMSADIYITLEGTITDNIGDYIDDGSLIIIAEQNSAQWRFWRWTFRSQLGTDYVKVDVTSTPKPHVVILNVAPSSTEVNPGDDMMTFKVEVRNDGAPCYGYVGGAAKYPNETYCNIEWEKTDYLNTGDAYTAHLDWTVPEDATLGSYGFVSATWDACWTECEAEPCYLDGCCDGEQHRYEEENVFEVVVE